MKQLTPFVLLPLFALIGCEPVFEQSAERQIMVDSIVAPDTVDASQGVTIEFYGTMGENRCWSFYKFETDRAPDRLAMKVLVRFKQDGSGCTPGLVDLNGVEHQVQPPHAGDFRVVVLQPTSDSLVHVVHVR
jgi:hypothetical protein